MKKLKWSTTSEYVDKETGEVLTKEEVDKNYIIIKKIIKHETYDRYVPQKGGWQLLTKFGLVRITNECTRAGKQLKLL